MKLFTVGPVEMDPRTRELGNIALPYFRTPDFSKLMFELERNILELIDAPSNARAVLLTASGSGAMESAVVSVFNRNDKLLIINGGTFGRRFADICAIHRIPYTEIHVPFERDLILSDLEPFAASGYTGLLIQGHETSIGKQYDLKMVGDWCERQGLLLVADCVSSFLTDEFSMRKMNVDVFFTASQKALALPPGLSIVSCSERVLVDRLYAPERVRGQLYLDLHDAFVNAERGQTPFTPALSIILQLDDRLKRILAAGGVTSELALCGKNAAYFRKRVERVTPFRIPTYRLSNGLTPLLTGPLDAHRLFLDLMERFGQVITPCGGELANSLTRVGHMGYLKTEDYDRLIECIGHVIV